MTSCVFLVLLCVLLLYCVFKRDWMHLIGYQLLILMISPDYWMFISAYFNT